MKRDDTVTRTLTAIVFILATSEKQRDRDFRSGLLSIMVRRDQKTVQENRKAGTVILTAGATDVKRLHPRTIGDTPPSKKQNGVLEDPYGPEAGWVDNEGNTIFYLSLIHI